MYVRSLILIILVIFDGLFWLCLVLIFIVFFSCITYRVHLCRHISFCNYYILLNTYMLQQICMLTLYIDINYLLLLLQFQGIYSTVHFPDLPVVPLVT